MRCAATCLAALLTCACSMVPGDARSDADDARKSALGKDFALVPASITLPMDDAETFPGGPNVALVETNCRACHSPSMILTQPPLSHEEWVKEVSKMRTTFKAVVPEEDVPGILAYLDDFSAKQVRGAAKPAAAPPK